MITKVRISLWDIFVSLISGLALISMSVGCSIYSDIFSYKNLNDFLKDLPTFISIFFVPAMLFLVGLLLEPVANLYDKKILNKFFERKMSKKDQDEMDLLEKKIKEEHLKDLNKKINTFLLCKEYVETNQLSTTFMIFLSKYGFYRNMALIFSILPFYNFILNPFLTIENVEIFLISFFLVFIFKKRSDDFFNYQASVVYRCFLVDKALKKNR